MDSQQPPQRREVELSRAHVPMSVHFSIGTVTGHIREQSHEGVGGDCMLPDPHDSWENPALAAKEEGEISITLRFKKGSDGKLYIVTD